MESNELGLEEVASQSFRPIKSCLETQKFENFDFYALIKKFFDRCHKNDDTKNVTGMKIFYQGVIFGENSKKPDVYICYVFKWPE